MEQHRAALTNILHQQPHLDPNALTDDLRQQLTVAVRQVDPSASVTVELHGNWVSITPSVPSSDAGGRDAVTAAIYEAKGAWYRQLLCIESSGASS